MAVRRLLVAAALLALGIQPASAQTGENILIVTNTISQASGEIAEYYARARAVPGAQILRLPMPMEEEIDRRDYVSKIEQPIAAWLTRHAAQDRILYIVLTKHTPLRIAGTVGQQGTVASVDSELTLLYRKMYGGSIPTTGRIPNPLFVGEGAVAAAKRFDHRVYDIYLVGRLDGYTVADVKAVIDRGVAPAKQGSVVLDGKLEVSDAIGNKWLRSAAAALQKMPGWSDRVVIDSGQTTLMAQTNVMGFYTWGSNAVMASDRHFKHQFLPGAIAGEYVSTDARTFKEPPDDWTINNTRNPFGGSHQSLIGDLIRDGISGVAGHVAEPFLNGTIRPDILFPAYASGFNLIESFYLAMPSLSWQTVVIGDPLCAPFATGPRPMTDLDPAVDPESELPSFFSGRRLAAIASTGAKPEAARWLAKADVRRAKGDSAALRQALEEAIKVDEAYTPAQFALAMLYESEGDVDRAIARYQRVVDTNPTHATALNNLAYLLAVRKGDPQSALLMANRAYRLSISDPAIADTLAWIYHLLGKDALAEPIIVIAARQRPDEAEIRLHAAVILAALGKITEARPHLDAAVRLDETLAGRSDVTELRAKVTARK